MDKKGAIGIRGVIIVLVLIIVAFLLQNSQIVEIQFLGWKWSMSKVILILFSMFVGAVIGLILGRELFRKREKKDKAVT